MMKLINWFQILAVLAIALMMGSVHADSTALYYYNLGVQSAAQEKLPEAKTAFDQALLIDPQSYPVQRCLVILADVDNKQIKKQTAVHLFRGFLSFNRYKTDEAILELNKAIELDPQYAISYSHRADAFRDKRQMNEALADYDKALGLSPKYATAYLNRANLYADNSEFDRAIADYNHALEIEPLNVLAYYNRGNTYAKHGRYEQAIADYKALLVINPFYPHAYVRMGLTYEKIDRTKDALSIYKAYLQKLDLQKQDKLQEKWVRDKVKSLEKQP
jgi:tetratricopeptide (TPR) repeat protein